MKLRNHELKAFITHISPFSLSGTEGRMRNRLKKILIEKFQRFESDRQDLINQHTKLDEYGNPIKTTLADNKESIEIADMNALNRDFLELSNEYVYILEDQINEQMLRSIKATILSDTNKYADEASDIWEFACQTVEEINYPETQPQVGD